MSRLSIQSSEDDIESNINYLNFINEESKWILDWIKIKKTTRTDPLFQKLLYDTTYQMVHGQKIVIQI